MTSEGNRSRIGIYAGTFDPVHAGHVSFALHAMQMGHLDEVYFMPERMPRRKPGAAHYGHRVAMLRRAIKPHQDLRLLELVDKHFTLERTLPQLRRLFTGNKLVLLMGADVFVGVPLWAKRHDLLKDIEFVVSIRGQYELPVVLHTMQKLALPAPAVTVVDSMQPDVSSTQMRLALALNRPIKGLLPSVQRYANKEWLYVQIPRTVSKRP